MVNQRREEKGSGQSEAQSAAEAREGRMEWKGFAPCDSRRSVHFGQDREELDLFCLWGVVVKSIAYLNSTDFAS